MTTNQAIRPAKRSGSLVLELIVAMGILTIAVFPLITTFAQLQKAVRNSYQRAVAMEIIDGEMEILMAGEWREFKEGAQPYPLRAGALTNLPPGRAVLSIAGKHVRLEWFPEKKDAGGKILREAEAR